MSRPAVSLFFLPPGTLPAARLILWTRALRAFGDGYMSLLLPFYLTLLGFSALEVGVIITATLLGSGLMTLAVGFVAHRYRSRSLLLAASLLMAATGIAFVAVTDFWPLLLVALVGTLNPSSGDVSVFLPLEQALLSHAVSPQSRTALFARYSLIGALVGALGAQAAGFPALAEHFFAVDLKIALQGMFVFYGVLGGAILVIYRRLSPRPATQHETPSTPLGNSKRTVFKLAARFGLVNTMVFTHLPSNIFLILVPFMPTLPLALTFLFLRSALSQMDVPARTSYVMAVVSPGERPAAASMTGVPRSLAAAINPAFAGYLLSLTTFGWPLVICGGLKIVYDLLLLKMFSRVKPPEERGSMRNAECGMMNADCHGRLGGHSCPPSTRPDSWWAQAPPYALVTDPVMTPDRVVASGLRAAPVPIFRPRC